METKKDGKGNICFDVENIRVTVLPKTWNNEPGIRIQAYKGEGQKLFQGAELPIKNKEVAFDLLSAIHKAIETNTLTRSL